MEKCRFCGKKAVYAGALYVAEEGDDVGYVCGDHVGRVSKPVSVTAFKVRRGRDSWKRYVETGKLA